MTKRIPAWTAVVMAVAVPMWLMAAPALAQAKGGSSGGGGGHASSGGGGGGHASAGGGGGHAGSSGGSHVGGGSSGGARIAAGGAVSRGSINNGSSRGAVAARSGSTSTAVARPNTDSTASGSNVPPYARPRDGRPSVGTAVPRSSVAAPSTGVTSTFIPGYYGYYPYGLGLGFLGGYYGGYSGYYGGYDDEMYDPGYASAPGRSDDSGGLKLKIKPSEASVYVDGYYVGVVNDFDGVFQKLTIEPGSHRMEIRAPGYETLTFDIRIESGHTTTYRGEMKKLTN